MPNCPCILLILNPGKKLVLMTYSHSPYVGGFRQSDDRSNFLIFSSKKVLILTQKIYYIYSKNQFAKK